ncbi:MAG: ABC transporter ATP-binding protein [Actinomycetota bacterium]|nr:ABC transporter ATP-binding protein [Actinomycetota bacterium]
MSEDTAPVAALDCRSVRVSYRDTEVVCGVDLSVARGSVLALLGPSGSGKSTLLHAIAGLVTPSAGQIWIDGKQVVGAGREVSPEDRTVGMVFQDFALWPHLSALDIVAYPLRRAHQSRSSARSSAAKLLSQLNIAQLADRRPAQLSGGEQQRVGLARALARQASLYLLDEPTAHLDTQLRSAFTDLALARRADSGAALVYATHDAAEALSTADKIALIIDGAIVQDGAPSTVYEQPVDLIAARLTGPCSVLQATVIAGEHRPLLQLGVGSVAFSPDEIHGLPTNLTPGRPLTVLVRPDWVTLGGDLQGVVATVGFRGPFTDYRLHSAAGSVLLQRPGPPRHAVGDRLPWTLRRGWVLTGESTADADAALARVTVSQER